MRIMQTEEVFFAQFVKKSYLCGAVCGGRLGKKLKKAAPWGALAGEPPASQVAIVACKIVE